jgi:hypothetical protein
VKCSCCFHYAALKLATWARVRFHEHV